MHVRTQTQGWLCEIKLILIHSTIIIHNTQIIWGSITKWRNKKKKENIYFCSIAVRYQHVNCAVWVCWLPKDIFMVAWDSTHNKMQNHICFLSLNCYMMFTQPLHSGMCQTHGWIKRMPAKYIHFLKVCKWRTSGMHNSTSLLKVSLAIFLFVTGAM